MDSPAVLWLSLLVLVTALLSRRLRESPISAPMLVVAAGGAFGLARGLPSPPLAGEVLRSLFEVTLALVVFGSATRAGLAHAAVQRVRLARLALLALPATVLLGTLVARALWPHLPAGSALFVATASAATDSEVARPFFEGRQTPPWAARLLTAEGGLTDGLLLSALWVSLELGGEAPATVAAWTGVLARQVGLALLVGGLIGWAGGWLLLRGTQRGLFEPGLRQLATVALAGLAWAAAARLEASGLTAAFCAGFVLARTRPLVARDVLTFLEAEGRLLLLVSFAIAGALLVPLALAHGSARSVLWAALSLFVLRALPVGLALAGTGLRGGERAALGWMGPRGLPTVVLGLLWHEGTGSVPEREALGALSLLVLASVVLHGLTAGATARLLARASTTRAPGGAVPV